MFNLISRTLGSLKKQLLPALQPFKSVLPSVPTSENDIELYEDKPPIEGAEPVEGQIRSLEGDQKGSSLVKLEWPRWKKVYVRWVFLLLVTVEFREKQRDAG